MLRWSDGSVSLQLGSDLFDVAPSQGATLARPSDPKPQSARGPSSQPEAPTSNSNTTFVCVAARDQGVMVTETAIAGQLSLVPTSMTSKTHLELARHVGQQHVKHSRMKILDDIHDPALLLKASGPKVKTTKTTRKPTRGRAAKREPSEESDERGGQSVRRVEGEYDEDDGFVVADSEEDEDTDEAAYGTKKKVKAKKGKKRKGSEEVDEMEEAERRIEERERERKRAKKEGGKQKKSREYVDSEEEEEDAQGEADMEMDVESEDD